MGAGTAAIRRLAQRAIRWARPRGLVALLAAAPTGVLGAEVLVLAGDESGPLAESHAEAIGVLASRLVGVDLTITPAAKPSARAPRDPDLVVAVGIDAMRVAVRRPGDAAVIAMFVAQNEFEQVRLTGRSASAVLMRQPPERQLNLIRLLTPERTRIGLLTSEASAIPIDRLQRAARAQKLELIHEAVGATSDLPIYLQRVIDGADALLAVPDPTVYNSATISRVLLATFRARQPVYGFSPAYVRAGALAAVFSTPAQLAEQTAAMVKRALAGQPLPPPENPRAFMVTVNRTVAQAFNLNLPEDAVLRERLAAMER